MGLDISAYGNLKEIPRKEDLDEHWDSDIVIWEENPFLYQLGSLKRGSVYEVTSVISSFRAGSYTGYNEWRKTLLTLITEQNIDDYWYENMFFTNYDYFEYQTFIRENKLKRILKEDVDKTYKNLENMPFAEIINFSDGEGFIGPEVCEKLYLDFVKYDKVAKEKMSAWYYGVYQNFMNALSIKGCVLHFH